MPTADQRNLSDPQTCGEDFARNLVLAVAEAPANCLGCADYHIVSTLKRLSGHMLFERGGRTPLLEAIRHLLVERAAADADGIDVVVAASADTGVLSTCASAALLSGEDVLRRVRFTVLDRCRTPLILCDDFAARNGITLRTETVDLLETASNFPADLIVVHNLLPFLPGDRHSDLFLRLRRWLKPHGCILVWQPVLPQGDRSRFHERQKKQVGEIKETIEGLTFEVGEPRESLFARVERNVHNVGAAMQNILDPDSLKILISSAGLKLWSFDELFFHLGRPEGEQTGVPCILAVAGRSD